MVDVLVVVLLVVDVVVGGAVVVDVVLVDVVGKTVVVVVVADNGIFKKVVQFVYNNAWHDKFNELLIKKTYQLSAVLFPEMSFEEFKIAVNG